MKQTITWLDNMYLTKSWKIKNTKSWNIKKQKKDLRKNISQQNKFIINQSIQMQIEVKKENVEEDGEGKWSTSKPHQQG